MYKRQPKKILLNFDKEYPIEGVFTKPEILTVRPIPPLKLPKTIEPIVAITKNTPFEKIGKMLAPKEEEEEPEEEEFEEGEEYEEEEEPTDVEQGTPRE